MTANISAKASSRWMTGSGSMTKGLAPMRLARQTPFGRTLYEPSARRRAAAFASSHSSSDAAYPITRAAALGSIPGQ